MCSLPQFNDDCSSWVMLLKLATDWQHLPHRRWDTAQYAADQLVASDPHSFTRLAKTVTSRAARATVTVAVQAHPNAVHVFRPVPLSRPCLSVPSSLRFFFSNDDRFLARLSVHTPPSSLQLLDPGRHCQISHTNAELSGWASRPRPDCVRTHPSAVLSGGWYSSVVLHQCRRLEGQPTAAEPPLGSQSPVSGEALRAW